MVWGDSTVSTKEVPNNKDILYKKCNLAGCDPSYLNLSHTDAYSDQPIISIGDSDQIHVAWEEKGPRGTMYVVKKNKETPFTEAWLPTDVLQDIRAPMKTGADLFLTGMQCTPIKQPAYVGDPMNCSLYFGRVASP